MIQETVKKVISTAILAGCILMAGVQAANASEWYDKVKIGADIRYRHENIVEQKDQLSLTGSVETYNKLRDRQRVRLRLSLEAKVNDNWKIKTRLATGNGGINSTNQTLDGAYANKAFDLDLAYAEGKLFGPEKPVVTLRLGKIKNAMINPGKGQLLWDSDVTPEGIAALINFPVGDMKLFSTITGCWLDEVSSSIDTMYYGAQAGIKMKVGDIKLKIGAGLNAITNSPAMFSTNINVGEGFVEASTKLAGQAFKLFGHFAQNAGAADSTFFAKGSTATTAEKVDTSAMVFGAQFGKASKAGTYQVKAHYKKYGNGYRFPFSDSDFADAQMDSSGIVLAAAYAPWDKTTVGLTYFINTYENTNTGIFAPLNYNRLQLDLKLKY